MENSEQPLVSIIISSYNYGRYLRDAIDNALRQTIPAEVIVVDDGSSDGSPEIIRSYGNRIISIFKNNGGQASSMNVGFQKSKGNIIIFLDSDDILYPEAVEKIIPCFDPIGPVKVHWQMEEIDGSGKKNNRTVPKYQLAEGDYLNAVIDHGPVEGGGPPYSPPTSGNAWSRKFLKSIMPIPEDLYKTNTDKYLHFLAPVYGNIKAIHAVLGAYRVHGENYSLHPVEEYADEFLSRFEKTIEIMDHHLQKLGIHAQTGTWSRDTWYHLIIEGIELITSIVAPQEKFILVDEDNWGIGSEVRGRQRLHLAENCAAYGGLPGDSKEAIRWLEACRAKGSKYIFFTSTSAWWLEYYKELADFLVHHAQLILKDRRLVGYKFQ